MEAMAKTKRPTKEELGRIAERQPELLNMLVAYFVFEWRSVLNQQVPTGIDQTGVACRVPDYVRMWGVDQCLHYLLQCPEERTSSSPGFLSEWLLQVC